VAAFIAKDIEKQIMLAGFQISHGVGLKGSSHNHHIFYVHLYWVHDVKFVNLYAPSFTTYRDTGAVSKKEHYLSECSGAIFEVPKCSKVQIFRGAAPNPTGRAYLGAYIAPQTS